VISGQANTGNFASQLIRSRNYFATKKVAKCGLEVALPWTTTTCKNISESLNIKIPPGNNIKNYL
jgi:hypothetical protein